MKHLPILLLLAVFCPLNVSNVFGQDNQDTGTAKPESADSGKQSGEDTKDPPAPSPVKPEPPAPSKAGEEQAEPEQEKKPEPKPEQEKKPEPKPEQEKKPEPKPEQEKKPEQKQPKEAKPAPPQPITPIGYSGTPMLPGQPWRVHDISRPRPGVVTPGKTRPADAPSDAIVLFNGRDLSHWGHPARGPEGGWMPAKWKIQDGYMEAVRGSGSLFTLDNFGSCQLHIEWATPTEVHGDGQGRGNSGIKFLGKYEVQVLDSFNNRTYADGQAAAVYGQFPPLVNASLKPGQWQAYDIIFEIAKFDLQGKLIEPAFLTVFHNGVLVHHRRELTGPTGRANSRYSNHPPAGSIMLQDHGNPVRYRNIWIRRL